MKKTSLYLWQLPQNVAGLFLLLLFRLFYGRTTERMEGGILICFSDAMRGGISLGRYIFLDNMYHGAMSEESTVRHELGHCRQSEMLGWLYLLVVGLPSIIHAAFYKYDPSDPHGYYRYWCEAWADRLGGVKR